LLLLCRLFVLPCSLPLSSTLFPYTTLFRSSMLQNSIFVVIYMICVFVIDFKFALLVVIGGLLTNLLFSRIFKYTKQEANALTKRSEEPRLNSSHVKISYAVFCLKKKRKSHA